MKIFSQNISVIKKKVVPLQCDKKQSINQLKIYNYGNKKRNHKGSKY